MENGERKKCLAGPRSIVLCGVSGASPSAGESTRAGVPGELSDIAARRASGDGQRTKDKGQRTKDKVPRRASLNRYLPFVLTDALQLPPM